MSETVTCQGCSQEFPEGETRIVGKWPFCSSCFEDLLKKPKPTPKTPPEALEAEPEIFPVPVPEAGPDGAGVSFTVSAPVAVGPTCRICENSIGDGHYENIGGLVICEPCLGRMLPDWKDVKKEQDQEEEEWVRPKREPIKVDPIAVRNLQCDGCGRPIPEKGSKELEGRRYCPDCYRKVAALAEEKAAEGRAADMEEVAGSVAPKLGECAACGGNTPPIEVCSGFAICQSCKTADLDSALTLARAKHKNKLKAMAQNIEE